MRRLHTNGQMQSIADPHRPHPVNHPYPHAHVAHLVDCACCCPCGLARIVNLQYQHQYHIVDQQ